jgi:hypothetical protein
MKPWASTAPAPLFHPDQSSAEIATIQKDVKNADRSGDVYENKGQNDKLTGDFRIFNGHFRQKCRILSICERKSVKKQVSGAAELAARHSGQKLRERVHSKSEGISREVIDNARAGGRNRVSGVSSK